MKTVQRWFSGRLNQEIAVARWGTFGRPVLDLWFRPVMAVNTLLLRSLSPYIIPSPWTS